MTNDSDLRCSRVRLLLSLAHDGEATPDQHAEIDAHLPGCAGCRAAKAADEAVRERLAVPAAVPTGFGDRVSAGVARQRLEARAQNRFLVTAAAAAVLVAGIAMVTFESGVLPRDGMGGSPVAEGSPRDIAGSALSATLAFSRSNAEDR